MKKLGIAVLFASSLLIGCVHEHDHDRYAHRDRNRCEAPATGVCAGCEASCRGDDVPYCVAGRSVPPQGTTPAYCSEEASCICRD